MTATPKGQIDWGRLTEVEAKTLKQVVYTIEGESTDWVDIKIKCIQPGPNGWKFQQFVEEIRKYFAKYVLPPSVRDKTSKSEWPWVALKKAAPNRDFESCGVISEFLLYLFTEVYLDAPLAAHRLYELDSRNQEKKGSDGLFVGRHNDEECLFVGEAKFYEGISQPIEDAFESISEFHSRGVNDRMERELDIADSDLADKLDSPSSAEIDKLSRRLAPHAHEDYKIVHPLFIGHQTAKIDWYPAPGEDILSPDDDIPLKEQVESELESSINEISYMKKQKDKRSDLDPSCRAVEIVLFPFPVHDTREFKQMLYQGLFEPHHA